MNKSFRVAAGMPVWLGLDMVGAHFFFVVAWSMLSVAVVCVVGLF